MFLQGGSTSDGRRLQKSPRVGSRLQGGSTTMGARLQPSPNIGTQLQGGSIGDGGRLQPASNLNGQLLGATAGPAGSQGPNGQTQQYDQQAQAQAQAEAAAAAEEARVKAEEDAKRNKLRSEGGGYLNTLMKEYAAIMAEIERVGKDQGGRLNQEYDGKVAGQVDDMNLGMYDVDASAAASNLADSSFRSFDRGKVRKAADGNISTLNDSRRNDLSEVGSMVSRETARFKGEQDGIGRTRDLLNKEEDIDSLQSTVNSLDKTRRGLGAEKAKFGTRGEFVEKANKLGNYDTSKLEATLASVVGNSSATSSTKSAAVNDILKGAGVDEKTKKDLQNKYIQIV